MMPASRREMAAAAVMLLCGSSAAAQTRIEAYVPQDRPPDYWESFYRPMFPNAYDHVVTIRVRSVPEAEAGVRRIAEGMGGEVKVLPSGEKRILRFAAADKDADRVRRGLSALGDMQVFQRHHRLITRLEAEVDSKIAEIEAEIGRNAGDLAKMPIASVLMKATLDKLRRSKGLCDAARERSIFSIELVPDWEAGAPMRAAGPPEAE